MAVRSRKFWLCVGWLLAGCDGVLTATSGHGPAPRGTSHDGLAFRWNATETAHEHDGGAGGTGDDVDAAMGTSPVPPDDMPSAGRTMWETMVQPLLASRCGSCHLGKRFGFASLARAGAAFTADETRANYAEFLTTISLDAPEQSRLLVKPLDGSDPRGIEHAGGVQLRADDETYRALRAWIDTEKAERCPSCGTSAPVQYLAYVEEPRTFWALDEDPRVTNLGDRTRSRIMMVRLDPATRRPSGEPFAFLPDSFCGADGKCDFARLAVSHGGERMAFACRLSLAPADFALEVRWNLCIAEIGADGRAVNPRFLLPEAQRHRGRTYTRTDPFGIVSDRGFPLQGEYDAHFQVRTRSDRGPAFSPDDTRIYYTSRGPTPHDGRESYQAYHGFEVTDNVLAVRTDGTDRRTIYVNEGGTAEFPFFLHDGTLAFHTWNLERTDRHMYTRATPDGNTELPILGGKVQGPNMWGEAVQLANGLVLGMTGRRRSSVENYTPFTLDHTLGTGLETDVTPLHLLDPAQFEQIHDFPGGYCDRGPDGVNCSMDRYYADPAFWPDGQAVIAYTDEHVQVPVGSGLMLAYPATGERADERVASLEPYFPRRLGIATIDHHGRATTILPPPSGTMLRYPVWVGPRSRERVLPWTTREEMTTTELHIADVPLWMSFRDRRDPDRSREQADLDRIVALRVLVKDREGNACTNDAWPYRRLVEGNFMDHPTHLGITNATGYRRLEVGADAGGDGWGDVRLQADRSVRLRLPARALLLFQGVDAQGHVVRQHERVFALPPGHASDTSVARGAYAAQCGSCHGNVTPGAAFRGLRQTTETPFVPLTYETMAQRSPVVDLTAPAVRGELLTFQHALRPLVDRACVSCHSGDRPAGELSLEARYSERGNYPAGRWASDPSLSRSDYLASVPPAARVPAYNYSMSWAWLLRQEDNPYKAHPAYAGLLESQAPVGELMPWDPAYQNLWANDNNRFRYLGSFFNSNFGRSDREGGLSSDAWLVEILTGRDLDPTKTFMGPDHTHFLNEDEVRRVMAVIDTGFPYMSRCDDRTVPSGVNAGRPWGDPTPTDVPTGR